MFRVLSHCSVTRPVMGYSPAIEVCVYSTLETTRPIENRDFYLTQCIEPGILEKLKIPGVNKLIGAQ